MLTGQGTKVRFYLNGKEVDSVDLQRNVTECDTVSQLVFVGDEEISIGRLRYTRFPMSTSQVLSHFPYSWLISLGLLTHCSVDH